MKVLDAILEELKPYPIRESLIVKKCIDFNVDAGEDYNATHREDALRIVVSVLTQYLSLGSISEGGVSISIADTKLRIRQINDELGIDEVGLNPTVEWLDI